MKCGIVILNYNSYSLTKKLVDHCLEMSIFDKIVLIDNNSKDNFNEEMKKWNSSKIHYIKNNLNSGYASGNNMGLKYLKEKGYKIAFIANPDVWFEEKTICSIADFLAYHEEYGVCSCRRFLHENEKTRQFWWIPTFKDALRESFYFMRRYEFRKTQEMAFDICEKNKEKEAIDVEVVGGAFFGCNLDIMEKIGYLDEDTFLWFEENILSFKLKQNGYKVSLLQNVFYNHNHVSGGHGNKNIKVYLKSKKVFCYKYLNINFFQKLILNIFDFIGAYEERLICLIFDK